MTPTSNTIDFLKSEKESGVQARLFSTIRKAAAIILAVYLLLLAGIFSAWFYFKTASDNVSSGIATGNQRLAKLAKIESSQRLLKQRTTLLLRVFEEKDKSNYSLFLSKLDSITEGLVLLTQETIIPNGKNTITGYSENSLLLSDFIDKIPKENFLGFNTVNLVSLLRSETGSYTFTVELVNEDEKD